METIILEFIPIWKLDYLFYEKRERPWIYISMCPYMLTEIPEAFTERSSGGKEWGRRHRWEGVFSERTFLYSLDLEPCECAIYF